MASPEISFAERTGYRIRNIGLILSAIGLFAPSLLVPSLGLAASGEVFRRVSKQNG